MKYTFIHSNAYVAIDFMFQIFGEKKKKKSADFARKRDALVVVDILVETCICTLNKLIKSLC